MTGRNMLGIGDPGLGGIKPPAVPHPLLAAPGYLSDSTFGDRPPAGFDVQVSFVGDQAVLAVSGTVDTSGACRLGAFFDSVIASGYLSVVLDLDEVELMGTDGLKAISYGASRVAALSGEVTIRPPSAMVLRAFDISWLSGQVRFEVPGLTGDYMGPEQSVAVPRGAGQR